MANDMTILLVILVLFIGLGTVMPFIEDELEVEPQTTIDTEGFVDDVGEEVGTAGVTTVWEIIISILGMFTWTFGQVPWIIDALFLTPIRIVLVILIARQIWPGGGA
jgi:hypothetical protein